MSHRLPAVLALLTGCVAINGPTAHDAGADDGALPDVVVSSDASDGVDADGAPDVGVDVGAPDTRPPDTGRSDSGRPDTGPPDTGPPDTGSPDTGPGMLPLPNMRSTVVALAAERPDLLASSCVAMGGNNDFLFELVRRLRAVDDRWGLNWKRGRVGSMSQDVVDYHHGHGTREGSTDVYIIDVIRDHCGTDVRPGWTDVTEGTAMAGSIGRWTLMPLP